MALNPIAYTEKIVRGFLRYQLTAYPFADEHLHEGRCGSFCSLTTQPSTAVRSTAGMCILERRSLSCPTPPSMATARRSGRNCRGEDAWETG